MPLRKLISSTGASFTASPAYSSIPRHPRSFTQPRSSSRDMRTQDLPVPELARNMRLIGHCDQGGRPDGVQIMVHRGFAYVGHMFSKGFSVIDVKDPARPKAVQYVPAAQSTWNIPLQTHDDLLLVINAKDMFAAPEFQDEKAYYKGELGRKGGTGDAGKRVRDWRAGLAVYDISRGEAPREIGFMPLQRRGLHRFWDRRAARGMTS